jgi:Arc/MetJ family transcription regulator
MTTDIDHDLDATLWETLKALRLKTAGEAVHSAALAELVARGLASLAQGQPAITAAGRTVLLRGSPRLWDVAA